MSSSSSSSDIESDAPKIFGKSSGKHSALYADMATQSPLESTPSRNLQNVISCTPDDVINPRTGEDSGRTYVNLIRHLKAVWPSREGKKAGGESKKKRSSPRSTRVLELQLKLQLERIRYEWLMRDGQASWRPLGPYGPLDSSLADPVRPAEKNNHSSVPPLGSIQPAPSSPTGK
ncbi:hypothetical protein MJO28_014357 [Puccinia striiformis f. sp. tritici]|uniref:Uncharacterized protein n=1 Tax=Puccinia striiformis f. sp. tritici TaxID=168172 RepID=A0ACC0DTD2_9BASI|nr:hypothetical protein Pst134EA_026813 [Puccinia striiformis f. sp. tritici]KAH9450103.1 hypothetical protein Pst134EA_026813 [Puccinia striiformis f. sp. tritici]KAI7938778.1 hypothetical protein MJO28_014357 [Puccinia striiformis f. sp. tritici]KAI7939492.1 hypothetical protein MJO29_014228 [Puccinia striiformis f. sp. tritici]KAI9616563.1 hypothetical protein H4Q26_010961 [Puccinia striiformis f. sp. tritici PST-130]